MDMKITGLPVPIISEAIKKARPARLHILEKMKEAIDKPEDSLSPHAPRLLSFRIDPELIGTVIGLEEEQLRDYGKNKYKNRYRRWWNCYYRFS